MARSELPFTRENWALFGVGLLVIVAGYVLLRIPPVNGFLSLTAAPILLVIGYCVLVPAAILVREGEADDTNTDTDKPQA